MGIILGSNEWECLTSSRSRESSLSVEGILCDGMDAHPKGYAWNEERTRANTRRVVSKSSVQE